MKCPKCDMSLMDGAKFCGSCGFTIPVEPPIPVASPPPSFQQDTAPVQHANRPGGAFHFDSDGRGQGRGYTWAIEHQGAFALAVVNLQSEQAICAEAGAMVSMSANVDLHWELEGGAFGALNRAVRGE